VFLANKFRVGKLAEFYALTFLTGIPPKKGISIAPPEPFVEY